MQPLSNMVICNLEARRIGTHISFKRWSEVLYLTRFLDRPLSFRHLDHVSRQFIPGFQIDTSSLTAELQPASRRTRQNTGFSVSERPNTHARLIRKIVSYYDLSYSIRLVPSSSLASAYFRHSLPSM